MGFSATALLVVLFTQWSVTAVLQRQPLSALTVTNGAVVSAQQVDSTVPVLTALDGPAAYNIANGGDVLQWDATVECGAITVGTVELTFTSPTGAVFVEVGVWGPNAVEVPFTETGTWQVSLVKLTGNNGQTRSYDHTQLGQIMNAWLEVDVTAVVLPTAVTSLVWNPNTLTCDETECNGEFNFTFTATGPTANCAALYFSSAGNPGFVYVVNGWIGTCDFTGTNTGRFFLDIGRVFQGVWQSVQRDATTNPGLPRVLTLEAIEVYLDATAARTGGIRKRFAASQIGGLASTTVVIPGPASDPPSTPPACSAATLNPAVVTTNGNGSPVGAVLLSGCDTTPSGGELSMTFAVVSYGNNLGSALWVDDRVSVRNFGKVLRFVNTTVTVLAVGVFDNWGNGVVYGDVPAGVVLPLPTSAGSALMTPVCLVLFAITVLVTML